MGDMIAIPGWGVTTSPKWRMSLMPGTSELAYTVTSMSDATNYVVVRREGMGRSERWTHDGCTYGHAIIAQAIQCGLKGPERDNN